MQLPSWFKQLLWSADYQNSAPREVNAHHRRKARLAVNRFEERRVLDATFALSGGVITLDGFTDESLSIQHDQMAGEYVFSLEAGSTWTGDPDGTTDNVARVADTGVTQIIVDASPVGMDPAPVVDVVVSSLTANNSLATLQIGVAGGEVNDVTGDVVRFVETLDIAAQGDATFKAANDLNTLHVTADRAEFHNDKTLLSTSDFKLGAVDVNELILSNQDTDIGSTGALVKAVTADITSSGGITLDTDVSLSNANFGELKISTDGNIAITEADAIELTNISAGDKLTLAADGDVTVVKVTAENVEISKSSSIKTDDATTDPVISASGAGASISLASSGDISGKSGALSIDAGGGDVSLTRSGMGDFQIRQTGAGAHSISFQDTGASGSISYTGNAAVTVGASSFEGSVDIDGSSLVMNGKIQGTGDIVFGSDAALTFNSGATVKASDITLTAGTTIEVDADDSSVELDASTISLAANSIGQAAENLNFSNATTLSIVKQAGSGAFLKETGISSQTNAVATSIENKNTAGGISIAFATDMLQVDVTAGKHTLATVNTTGSFSYDAGSNTIADSGAKLTADALALTTTGAVSLGSSATPLEVAILNDISVDGAGTSSTGGIFLKSTGALNLDSIDAGAGDAEFQSDAGISLSSTSEVDAAAILFASNNTTIDAAAKLEASQLTLLGATTSTSIGVGDDSSQTAKIGTAMLSNLGTVSKVVIGDAGLNAAVEIHEDAGLSIDAALVVRGKAISINSHVTTDGGFTIEGTGATTTVLSDQTITETGAGAITIDDSVLISSGAKLTLDTQAGDISITGDIEGVGGKGDAGLVVKSVSGDIALGDDPATDTIDGAGGVGQFGDVTATTSGEVTISGAVDANSLTVSAGSVKLREDIKTLAGVNITGLSTIDNDIAVVAGGNITTGDFAGAAAATHALSLSTATGAVTVGQLGGGGKSLDTIVLSGASVELGGDLTADGAVTVSGATTLATNVNVTANNSNVQFNNTVDSSTGSETLQVNAGSGDIAFAAATGAAKTVASFNAVTTGDVTLSGVKTGSGDIVVASSGSKAGVLKLSGEYESGGKVEFFATSAQLLSNVSVTADNDNITFATTAITTSLNAGDSEHGLTLSAGTGAAAIVDLAATAIGAKDGHLDHLVISANTATLNEVTLGDGQSRAGAGAGTALEVNVAADLTLTQSIDTTADASDQGGAVIVATGGATVLDAAGTTSLQIDTDAATSDGAVTLGKIDSTAANADGLKVTAGAANIAIDATGSGNAVALLELTGGAINFNGNIGSVATAGVSGKTTATAASNISFAGNAYNAAGGFNLTSGVGGTFNIDGGATSFVSAGEDILFNTGDIVIAAGGSLSVKIDGGAGADKISVNDISGPDTAPVTLDAGSGVVTAGAVGASGAHLDEIDFTGSTITLAGSIFAGSKAEFSGNTTISNSLTINTAAGTKTGAIAFNGTSGDVLIDNGSTLTLQSGATTTIDGDIGAGDGGENLSITSTGSVTLGTAAATDTVGTGAKTLGDISITTTADVTINAVVTAAAMTVTGDVDNTVFQGAINLDGLNAGGVNALEIEAHSVTFASTVSATGGGAISVAGAGKVGSGITLNDDIQTEDGEITFGLDATLGADVQIDSVDVTAGANISLANVNGGGHSLTINAGTAGDITASDIGSGAAVNGLEISNAAAVNVGAITTSNGLLSTSDSFHASGAVDSSSQAIDITARGDSSGVSIEFDATVDANGRDVILTAANDIVFGDIIGSIDGDIATDAELKILGIDSSTAIHFGSNTTGAAGVHISTASVSNIGGASDSEFSGGITIGDGAQAVGADVFLGTDAEVSVDQNLSVLAGAADIVLQNNLTTAGHDVTFNGANLIVAGDHSIGKSTDKAGDIDLSSIETTASLAGVEFSLHTASSITLGVFSDASGANHFIDTLKVATPAGATNATTLTGDVTLAIGGAFTISGDANIIVAPDVGGDVDVSVAGGSIDWAGSAISAQDTGRSLTLSIDNTGLAPLGAITFGNVDNVAGNFLTDLTVHAKDGLFANAGTVTTGGSIQVTGDVAMTGNVVAGAGGLTVQTNATGSSGEIDFSDAKIDGVGAVLLDSGTNAANDVLLGEVGGATAVSQLTVTTAGDLELNGDISTGANGAVDFTGALSVLLGSATTISTGNGNVLFNASSDLDGAQNLQIAAGTGAVQLGNIGANSAIESLKITGGAVTFAGAVGGLASAGVNQQMEVTATAAVKFEDNVYNADGGMSLTGSEFQINATAQTTTFASDAANISFLNGNLVLSKDASLQIESSGTSAGNGDIVLQNISGDTGGSGSVNLDAGAADLSTGLIGDSGNKDRIASVTLAGGTVTLDALLVAADFVSVTSADNIVLLEDTEICTLTGDVTLAGNLVGDADVASEDLTIVSGDNVALGVNVASTIGAALQPLGALDIQAVSDVTVNGSIVAESVTIAGNGSATASDVSMTGALTLNGVNAGGHSLSLAGESIAISDTVTVVAGGGNVRLTGAASAVGNDVDILGTVDVSAVANASISIDANFNEVLLSATGADPHLLTNQGAINIGSTVTLATDISLQSSNGASGATISLAAVDGADHALTVTAGDGDFTASGALGAAVSQLNGLTVTSANAVAIQSVNTKNGLTVTSSNTFTSGGKITTSNADVSIRAENQIGAAITLNGLEANGSDVTLISGGDIVFLANAVNSTGAGTLTLEGTTAATGIQFGHDAGADGVIDISLASLANVGSGFGSGAVLGRSDQTGLIELGKSGDVALSQGIKILAGDKLGAGADVTVTGNVSADSGFEIDGSGTTTVALAGNVTTSNAAIDIDAPIQLTGDGVELQSAGGSIVLDTVDADAASRSMLIDAGAGTVTVKAIGAVEAVSGGVAISGSTINMADVDTTSATADDGGPISLTAAAINLNGDLQTAGKLNGGKITVDGAANLLRDFTADTGAGNGDVAFTGTISSVSQTESFTIKAGAGSVVLGGNVSSGQFQISTANDVSLEGIDSNGETINVGTSGNPVDGELSLGGDLASDGADILLFAQRAVLRSSIQIDSTNAMTSGDITLGTVDVPGLTTVGDVGLSLVAGDGAIDLGGATIDGLDHFNLSATTVTLTAVTLGDGSQNALNPGDALHVDAANRLTVEGDITTGGGGVNLSGGMDGVVLNKAASTLVSITTAGGDIIMDDLTATASADTDGLKLEAGTGDVSLNDVGVGGSLASLEINAGATQLLGSIGSAITAGVEGLTQITSTGNINYTSDVYHATGGLNLSGAAHQINNDTLFVSTGGDISFAGAIEQPVDGAESSLTITAAAGAVAVEAMGRAAKSDIGAVSLTAGNGVSLGGDVRASSFQVTGDATLTSNVHVDTESRGGDIRFTSSVDGAHQLSLHAVDGDVMIGGATGENTRLAALTVETGQTLLLGGSVLLDGGGDIDFSDVKLLDVDDSLTKITFDTDGDLGATNAGRALLFSAAGDPFVETGLAVTIDTTVNGTGADAAITLAEMDVLSLDVKALSIVAQQTVTRGDGTGGGDISLTATGAGQVIEIQGDLDTSQSVSGKAGAISLTAANGAAVLNAGGGTILFTTDAAVTDADISFDVAVDSLAGEALTLTAGSATADINGALGAGGRLGRLTVNADSVELGADIVASGLAISGETSIDIDVAGVQIDTGGVDSFFQSSSIDNTGADAEIRGGGVFVYRGNAATDAISIGGVGASVTTAAVSAINAGAGGAAIETLQIGHADNQAGTIRFNEAGPLSVNANLLIDADDASVEINEDISVVPAGSSLVINAEANAVEIKTSGAGVTLTTDDGLIDINSSVTGDGKDLTLVAGSGNIQLGADAAVHTVGEVATPLGDLTATTTGDISLNAAIFADSVSLASANEVTFENQVVLHGSNAGGDSLLVEGRTVTFQQDATVQVQSGGGNVSVKGTGVGSSLTVLSATIENQAAGAKVLFDNQFAGGVALSADIATTGGEVEAGSNVSLTGDVTVQTTLGGSAGADVTFADVDADATATATNLSRQFSIVAGSGAIQLGDVGTQHAFTRGADAANNGGVDLQGGAVTVGLLTTSNGAVNGAGGDVKIDSASAEIGDIATSGNGKASGIVDISTSAGDAKLAGIDTSNLAAGTAVSGQAAGGAVLIDVTGGNLTLDSVVTSGDNAGSGAVNLSATGPVGGGITIVSGIDTRVLTGEGAGGDVTVDATGDMNLTGDVRTSTTNSGAGGSVSLKADGAFVLSGDIETKGTNGDGSGDVILNDAGGSLTLGTNTTITTASTGGGADGNVTFNGLVDASVAGGQSLTVDTGSTGVATFDDEVGSLRSLSDLHAVGGVKITGGVSSIAVANTQQFDGEVVLEGVATSLTKLVADTVQFNDVVNAGAAGLHQLEIDADLELNADIGDAAGLNALTVTGDSTLNGSAGTLQIKALTQNYGGGVTLNADTELTGADLTFQQAVDGAHALLIDASASGAGTGKTRFLESVGAGAALTSIDVNETTETGTAGGAAFQIVTTGNQTFEQATLSAETTLQSGGDIRFDGVVRTDGLGAHNLTVTGQGGVLVNNVTFASDLGQAGFTLGDYTQLSGRGVTTFGGGVIDGQLTVATVSAVLDNPSGADTLSVKGGNVSFELAGGATLRSNLDAGSGLVTFDVNRAGGSDSLTMESDAVITTTHASNRAVQVLVNQVAGGDGNATLGNIQATNGGVVVDVAQAAGGGAIIDGNAGDNNIAARQIALLAANGAGDSDAIETRTALLAVHNSIAGAVEINNTSDATTGDTLTLGEVREDAPGAALIASGLTQNATGILSVTTSGGLSVEEAVTSGTGGTDLKSGGVFDLLADVTTTGGNANFESGDTFTVLADVTTSGGGDATFLSETSLLLGDNTLTAGANETVIATNGGGDARFTATRGNVEVRSHISSDQGDISFDTGLALHFASAGDGADVVTNFAQGGRIFGNAGSRAGRAIPGKILFSNGATLDSGSGVIGDADYRAIDNDVVTVTTVTTPSVASDGTAKIRVILNDPALQNAEIYVDWGDRADAGQSQILYPPVTNGFGGGINDIRLDGNGTSAGSFNGGAGPVTHELSYQYRRGNPNDVNPFADIVIQVIVRPDHRAIPGGGTFGINSGAASRFASANELRSQEDLQHLLTNGIILSENGRIVEFNSNVELSVPSQGLFAALNLRENVVQVTASAAITRTPEYRVQSAVSVVAAQEFLELIQAEDVASVDEAKLYFTEILVDGSESRPYEVDLSLLKDGKLEELFKTFRNGLYKIQYKAAGAEKVEVLFQLRIFNHKIVPIQVLASDAESTSHRIVQTPESNVRVVSVETFEHLRSLLRSTMAELQNSEPETGPQTHAPEAENHSPADETLEAELNSNENQNTPVTGKVDATAEASFLFRKRRPVVAAAAIAGLFTATDSMKWNETVDNAISQEQRSLSRHARLARRLRK